MTANFISTLKQRIATIKLLPLLVGAASLAIAAGTLAPTFAQSTAPTAPTARPHQQGGWKKLNLTDDQKAQFKSIRESSKAQIDAILTQEQKDQLQAARGDRKNHRQVWKSLNLTADQKAQIKQIKDAAKRQMESILTPEQLQQWQQKQGHRKAASQGTQAP